MKTLTMKTGIQTELRPSFYGSEAIGEKPKGKPCRESDQASAYFGLLVRQDNGQGFLISG